MTLPAASTNVKTIAHPRPHSPLSPRFLRPRGLVWSLLISGQSPRESALQVCGSGWEINTMKTAFFVLCFLCATAAFGQSFGSAAVSAEIQPFQMASHTQRATQIPMASEQSLLEHSSYFIVQGERPLWEVQPLPPPPTPLGTIARMLRKEHEVSKKADFVRND